MSPNPADPASLNYQTVKLPKSGLTYEYIDQRPTNISSSTPTVLCCHGFPDQAYGYRYQIQDFVNKRGWRVIVPSQLGYKGTDKPDDISLYSYKNTSHNMAELLDAIGVKGKVIVVGHDWGGMVAWRFAQYFPERVVCITVVCTPCMPTGHHDRPFVPLERQVEKSLPNFGYQLYFRSDPAPSELESLIVPFLLPTFSPSFRRQSRKKLPSKSPEEVSGWSRVGNLRKGLLKAKEQMDQKGLTEGDVVQELEPKTYIQQFREGGLRGPLSWYKTQYYNWQDAKELPSKFPPEIPARLYVPTHDAALPPKMSLNASHLGTFEPAGNLEVRLVEGGDHWVLQDEKFREPLTESIVEFVGDVLGGRWRPVKGKEQLEVERSAGGGGGARGEGKSKSKSRL